MTTFSANSNTDKCLLPKLGILKGSPCSIEHLVHFGHAFVFVSFSETLLNTTIFEYKLLNVTLLQKLTNICKRFGAVWSSSACRKFRLRVSEEALPEEVDKFSYDLYKLGVGSGIDIGHRQLHSSWTGVSRGPFWVMRRSSTFDLCGNMRRLEFSTGKSG